MFDVISDVFVVWKNMQLFIARTSFILSVTMSCDPLFVFTKQNVLLSCCAFDFQDLKSAGPVSFCLHFSVSLCIFSFHLTLSVYYIK